MDGTNKDIIIAAATPLVSSAIGIIRISGTNSLQILSDWIDIRKIQEPKKLYLSYFKKNNKIIDQVQIVWYKEGYSYTGEEMVEIFTHGSPVGMEYIINLIIQKGARMALPGEFSRRALLMGKLSSLEAESIYERIEASNITEYLASVNLSSRTSEFLLNVKKQITEILSYIEVNIDFPDEDIPIDINNLALMIEKLQNKVRDVRENTEKYTGIKKGLKVMIAGLPNVGKSTLFNLLVGENRALVYDTPGTTRDRISAYLDVNGVTVELNDTAGIRDSSDPIERMGVEITMNAVKEAVLVLFVTDISKEWTKEENKFREFLIKNKKDFIIIGNKKDKGIRKEDTDITISAVENFDRKTLISSVYENTKKHLSFYDEIYFTNERHMSILKNVEESLLDAYNKMKTDNMEWSETIALSLREASHFIDTLNGRIVDDEKILDNIFNKFCVGK